MSGLCWYTRASERVSYREDLPMSYDSAYPAPCQAEIDRIKIIIAEADAALAAMLLRRIRQHYPRAVIQVFSNGRDTLNAYDCAGADLLFVHHAMPGLDGLTLIHTLRARGDGVPMIGMSGDPALQDTYLSAGAIAFVCRPELLSQLARLLQRFL